MAIVFFTRAFRVVGVGRGEGFDPIGGLKPQIYGRFVSAIWGAHRQDQAFPCPPRAQRLLLPLETRIHTVVI